MDKNIKRFNFTAETICICILILQLILTIYCPTQPLSTFLPPFIINLILYLILSTIFYFSYSKKYLIKNFDFSLLFGNKVIISENQSLYLLNKAIFFIGFVKVIILLIPLLLSLVNYYNLILFPFFRLIIITPLLLLVFLLIFYSIKYIVKANGYLEVTNKQVINNGILYNNPNDKRAVVEKKFGIGTTVNLATKQGRIILYVILSIPITILTLVFIILFLNGRINF